MREMLKARGIPCWMDIDGCVVSVSEAKGGDRTAAISQRRYRGAGACKRTSTTPCECDLPSSAMTDPFHLPSRVSRSQGRRSRERRSRGPIHDRQVREEPKL
eukprot:COSAG01_NODE_5877_length_3973_cov_2.627001_5_plen_102_part_00